MASHFSGSTESDRSGGSSVDTMTSTGPQGPPTFPSLAVHGGIGYDFGGQNILLLDLDRRNWDDSDLETDTRFQVVMQVKF